jgi:hypothetical protein
VLGNTGAAAVTGPRNPRAFARGQRLRAEIRSLLEQRPPLLPPLTAKEIRARLTHRPLPSVRTVQWHVAAVRLEAQLAPLSGDDSLRSAQFIA